MSADAREATSADRAILFAVGFLGALVALLSFMPWITHGVYWARTSLHGNEMTGVTEVGDGWLTAIAGAAAALVAVSALSWNLRGQLVASAIAICGLLVACVAGYDLINGVYEPRSTFLDPWFPFQVRREPALWATTAAGLAIATAGFGLLVVANRRPSFAQDPGGVRGTEGWA